MIITNLYREIIERHFEEIDTIYIISGYGSGGFLDKIVSAYPDLKIELYLGMTQEGLSESSHKTFQKITNSKRHVNVYYQIKGTPNHMKIYKLYKSEKLHKSFVGSANFTENGFEYNKEILLENHLFYEKIFKEQHLNSLICTDENIEEYINVHNIDFEGIEESESVEVEGFVHENKSKYRANIDRLIKIRNRASSDYFNEFSIEIIKNNDDNWAFTGINSGLHGQTPHIPIGTKRFHQRVFPRDVEFLLETQRGKEFKVVASSQYRDAIFFLDIDIYNYLRAKVGLKGKRPISRFDLEEANANHIKFIRLDELKYYIELY